MKTFKKLPGVLSLSRTIVATDAIMDNLFADGSTSPVAVVRHGIRGTQNINNDKERSVSNVQETDTAKLDVNAVGMLVKFDLRFLDLAGGISACAPSKEQDAQLINDFKDSLFGFLDKAKSCSAVNEIALRYARNIANARWLWRNRTIAEAIVVKASFNGQTITFNAIDTPLNDFEGYSDEERQLAEHIANGLSGNGSGVIEVLANIDFGVNGAVEVFPSQNYIDGKPKGFSRSLYKYGGHQSIEKTNNNVVGFAALRDQKITNALRTFDTWYNDYVVRNVPIPIEPNGASLDAQEFFRTGKINGAGSAFTLFLKLNEIEPTSKDGLFVIACVIRGGVYNGESDKTTDKPKKDTKVSKKDAGNDSADEADLADNSETVG